MRFRTRLFTLTFFLVALMAGSAIALAGDLAPGGSFIDDDGNIHEGNIEAIRAEEITKGCNPPTNDRYCPDASVTRGQMAAFLVRALDPPATTVDFFLDDDDSIFEADINRLAASGITKGCNPPANDRYCPDSKVTRGQMAAFLVRGFGYTDSGAGDLFTDDDSSVFETDIDRLGTAGVTKGCNPPENTRYCPDNTVKRDQMASFLARALGLSPIIPSPSPAPPPPPPLPENPEVFAIGDSVMLGVSCNPSLPDYPCYSPSMNLEGEIQNLTSDASVSRQFSAGKTVLGSWLDSGHDPDVVVVHLGTNYPPGSSQVADFMAVAENVPRVLFLTVKQNNTSWETTTNAVLHANVPDYENAEIVDWYAVATAELDMDAIDESYGAHLGSDDAREVYVSMIADAIAGP